MAEVKNIRTIVGAIIRNKDKILVCLGEDKVSARGLATAKTSGSAFGGIDEKFYRVIGGGVEFGEKIEEALKREIKEEINSGLENIEYLGFIENIFEFEGRPGHEIFFVYQADLAEKSLYDIPEMDIIDSRVKSKAAWVDISILKESHFYPEGIKKLINL